MCDVDPLLTRAGANRVQLGRNIARGHYESFFHRANHPTEPRAFWIRYTVCCPAGHPEAAVGELWAVYFDGCSGQVIAAKDSAPLADCEFADFETGLRIGGATLDGNGLWGRAEGPDGTIAWDLAAKGGDRPLLLLARSLYDGVFPEAKSLVPTPHLRHHGELRVRDEIVPVDGWMGSQNHNWGRRHTDHYAWGQVVGFDDAPQAFLEMATARVRVGPLWTPFMTLLVLRLGDEQIEFNGLGRALLARGHFGYFHWEFETGAGQVRVRGSMRAPRESFVALRYDNPPGGTKTCLNSKLAECDLEVERPGRPMLHLHTRHRGAFEILTDDEDHGLPILF
jgi:hypothetical protein